MYLDSIKIVLKIFLFIPGLCSKYDNLIRDLMQNCCAILYVNKLIKTISRLSGLYISQAQQVYK